MRSIYLTVTSGLMVLAMFAANAEAAKFQPAAGHVGRVAATDTHVLPAQYRLCVTQSGTRQCRDVEIYRSGQAGPLVAEPRVYGYQPSGSPIYQYRPPTGFSYMPTGEAFTPNSTELSVSPDAYWTGSSPWWELMDKLGRGGHQD